MAVLGGLITLVVAGLGVGPATAQPVTPGTSASPAASDPFAAFVGKTYSSVSVVGTAIPGGGPMRVSFGTGHRVAMSTRCNLHVGAASMTGSGITGELVTGPMASTLMACPPPRDGADAWLVSFTSVPLRWWSVGPVLTLASPLHTVILVQQ